jgi:hypothetical protein
VKIVTGEVDGGHFGIRDLDGFGILVFVEAALHLEAFVGRRRSDQLDDHRATDQRLAAPVLGDEGEEPMLDTVPLAGAGRMMGDSDGETGFIGEGLKLALPQANASAIAATAIGRDQEAGRAEIADFAQGLPPAPDALDSEGSGIVIDTYINPARVGCDVVDAVRRNLAQFGYLEVVDAAPARGRLGAVARGHRS